MCRRNFKKTLSERRLFLGRVSFPLRLCWPVLRELLPEEQIPRRIGWAVYNLAVQIWLYFGNSESSSGERRILISGSHNFSLQHVAADGIMCLRMWEKEITTEKKWLNFSWGLCVTCPAHAYYTGIVKWRLNVPGPVGLISPPNWQTLGPRHWRVKQRSLKAAFSGQSMEVRVARKGPASHLGLTFFSSAISPGLLAQSTEASAAFLQWAVSLVRFLFD